MKLNPNRRRRSIALFEAVEPRQLMSANVWKTPVSGNWSDPTKWSAGHVPTSTEDVSINAAGNYTVSVNAYAQCLKLTVGGGAGTQTLSATTGASLNAFGAVSVLAGDAINVNGGYVYSYAAANTPATLDGTITLSGTSASHAQFTAGGVDYSGTGSVVFATGGGDDYVNRFGGYDGTIGSGITIRGKSGAITGRMINKGTIKIEGGTADSWSLYHTTNQGSITSTAGASIEFDYFKNTAGHTVSLAGGATTFYYDFTNAGTLATNNVKVNLAATVTAGGLGTFTRVNSPVKFSGYYDGGGKAFAFDAIGKWDWAGGQLKNGSYDPTAANALVLAATSGTGYGSLNNVTLTGDLSIAAGTYLSAYGNVNLAGTKILLNGKQTSTSGFYIYSGCTLGGGGEVVFNTGGVGGVAYNSLGGGSGTIGSGVLVHGKSGSVTFATVNGTINADTANETITTQGLTNNGNVMATAGTIQLYKYAQTANGSLTVGIGGATSFGKFAFLDTTNAPVLAGSINAVLLNNYAPAAGTTFNVATFVKPATGTFATQNLDAGNSRGFDLTLTPTAMSLKAKASTNAFAVKSAAGALTVTGTALADTIAIRQSLGLLYATVNGKTSVFYDGQLIGAATVRAGAGNDSVTLNGTRSFALFGEAGNDTLAGSFGSDTLHGGDGSDLLLGGGGNDSYAFAAATIAEVDVIGEAVNGGVDTLDFGAMTTSVNVNLASDALLASMLNRTIKTQAAGQAANLENVTGGTANDTIVGNALANVLHGGLGNDTLTGGLGADLLYGDDGVDTFFAAGDNAIDLVDGGLGVDVKGSADATDKLVAMP